MNLAKLFCVWMWQLDHVLDILLCSTIKTEQSHFVRSFFESSSLQVVFDLSILATMLAQELAHLLGNHVFWVGVDMAQRDERDIIVCGRTLALVRWLLVMGLVLLAMVALLVREWPSRIITPNVGYWRDTAKPLLQLVLAMLRKSLRIVVIEHWRLFDHMPTWFVIWMVINIDISFGLWLLRLIDYFAKIMTIWRQNKPGPKVAILFMLFFLIILSVLTLDWTFFLLGLASFETLWDLMILIGPCLIHVRRCGLDPMNKWVGDYIFLHHLLLTLIIILLLAWEPSSFVCPSEVVINWCADVFFFQRDELLKIERVWNAIQGSLMMVVLRKMLRCLAFITTHEISSQLGRFDKILSEHVLDHLMLHFLQDGVLRALQILN